MNTPNNTLAERLGAITRSIASGANACGTLIAQDGRLNLAFVEASVKPTLEVYEDELAQLRRENEALSRDGEIKRQALESAVANIHDIGTLTGVGDAFRAALPGHPNLR